MQIELIGIAAAASVAHAIRDHTSRKSKLLLGSGLLMASALPFTFIAILPINKRLQSEQEQPDAQVAHVLLIPISSCIARDADVVLRIPSVTMQVYQSCDRVRVCYQCMCMR